MGKPKAPRRLADNEAMAKGQRIRISWQKLNLVAQLIRGKKADQAVSLLQFSSKRIARDVKKVLESAIANAENNHGLDVDKLYVKEAHVGPALVMKRFKAKSKGRAGRIIKPFANITVVVHEPPQPAAKPAETKEAA
jgi:large subunit ribosomal protein L22